MTHPPASGEDISLRDARRMALAAQGFDRPRPKRVTARAIGDVIRRLGLIQLDFVNVLVPAHYQVLFSRLGPYNRSRLDDVVYRRRAFLEQWAHEASIVPVESWPLLAYRRRTHRVRPWGFERFLAAHAEYVAWVLREVRDRGALTASDLPDPEGAPRRIADRWGWGLAVKRQVLEAHFGAGRLVAAARRPNFARSYDLAERVVPPELLRRRVDEREARRRLLVSAARALGVAAVSDLADYYRMPVRDARPRIRELVETGALHEVRVEGWREPALRCRDATLPRSVEAVALLSPFDPLIWYRPRVARLFDFEYRVEIFVPQPKRRWGYYVLPFLFGDRLVGRVDLKADRSAGRLLVQAAYRESWADPDAVAPPLARELRTLAEWLGLSEVVVRRRGGFAPRLARALT